MKPLCYLLIIFFFSSCSSPEAIYDYDTKISFDDYRTYSLYPGFSTGLSELSERRLRTVVEEVLADEDLRLDHRPDLYLRVYSEEFQEPSRNRLGIGIGSGGRNIGFSIGGSLPLGGPENHLELTFELVDAHSDELVWQAKVTNVFDESVTPEQEAGILREMVKVAFKAYPPED